MDGWMPPEPAPGGTEIQQAPAMLQGFAEAENLAVDNREQQEQQQVQPQDQHVPDSENTEDDETHGGYVGGLVPPSKRQKVGISSAARQHKSLDQGGCRNHTGFIGVRKRNWGMYAAEIRDGAKRRWLGSFSQAKEAGMAYDAALILQKKHRAKTNFIYSDFATIPRPGAEPGGKVRYTLIPKDIMDLYKEQYHEVMQIICNGGGLGMPTLGDDSGNGVDDGEASDGDARHELALRMMSNRTPVRNTGLRGMRGSTGRNYVSPARGTAAAAAAAAGALSEMAHQGGYAVMDAANGRMGSTGSRMGAHMGGMYGNEGMMVVHGGGSRSARSAAGGRSSKNMVMGYDLEGAAEHSNHGMDQNPMSLYMQGVAHHYLAGGPYGMAMQQQGGEDQDGQDGGDEEEEEDEGVAPGYGMVPHHGYMANPGYNLMGMAPMMPPGMMMPGMAMGPHMHPGMQMAFGYGYPQQMYPGGPGTSEEDGESEEEEEEQGQRGQMPGPMHPHPMYAMLSPGAWPGMAGGAMMAPGMQGMRMAMDPSMAWQMAQQQPRTVKNRSGAGADKEGGRRAANGAGVGSPAGRAVARTPTTAARGTPNRNLSPEQAVGNGRQLLSKRGSSDSEQHPLMQHMSPARQRGQTARGVGTSNMAPAQGGGDAQEHMYGYAPGYDSNAMDGSGLQGMVGYGGQAFMMNGMNGMSGMAMASRKPSSSRSRH